MSDQNLTETTLKSELTASEFREKLKSGEIKIGKDSRIKPKQARRRTNDTETVGTDTKTIDRALKAKKRSKAKPLFWIELELTRHGIQWIEEYQFAKPRRYRADLYLPEKNILIEYEGLISNKSRHTTITGYSGDCDKYNLAVSLGYKLFRFTALNYRTLMKLINGSGKTERV